jgi:hypothetical protein
MSECDITYKDKGVDVFSGGKIVILKVMGAR